MTNQEIYDALSKPGLHGAKAEICAKVGCSRNMLRLILKGGVTSNYEEPLVQAAMEVIERQQEREKNLAIWRIEKAQQALENAKAYAKQIADPVAA